MNAQNTHTHITHIHIQTDRHTHARAIFVVRVLYMYISDSNLYYSDYNHVWKINIIWVHKLHNTIYMMMIKELYKMQFV